MMMMMMMNPVADSGGSLLRSALGIPFTVWKRFGDRSLATAGPGVWNNLASQQRRDIISYAQVRQADNWKHFYSGLADHDA